MDEETAQRAHRRGLIRLAVFGAVAAVVGVGAVVLGLDRAGVDRWVYLLLGAVMLGSVLAMAGAVLRMSARERRLPPGQAAEERAARMAEAQRRMAAADERRWPMVLSAVLGVFWLVYLAIGLSNGSLRQILVSGFFVLLVMSTEVGRRRRRRRRQLSEHGPAEP